MKRQDKFPETLWFHYYNANPKNRITADCTIRAICTALDKPYNKVLEEMVQMQYKTGYSFDGNKGIEKYLKSQGWIKYKQPRKLDNTKYTGKEWCNRIQKFMPTGWNKMLAKIGGHHIVAIINGKVWDIWDSTGGCVGNYWIKI